MDAGIVARRSARGQAGHGGGGEGRQAARPGCAQVPGHPQELPALEQEGPSGSTSSLRTHCLGLSGPQKSRGASCPVPAPGRDRATFPQDSAGSLTGGTRLPAPRQVSCLARKAFRTTFGPFWGTSC